MSKWIKKDDKVLVTSGNDKGLTGIVLARKESKVIIQGVNVRKKHMKSRSQDRPSEIVEIEKPIHISNVALCDDSGKRIKLKVKRDGAKKELLIAGHEEKLFRTLKK
ncbi:MAG: 50S ribosomal protein L24 [Simkaniaceae bacterium]|nr:50S ribosomal protein L24 [Simkaniaceae bacterium]MCF7851883.1 50S ribosomal protein L24 [Simkaniaceae bacterium]